MDRNLQPNFKILNSEHSDYTKGFEVQSDRKEFISWNTTYAELEQSKCVQIEELEYGEKILYFKTPIRVGNILLEDFSTTLYKGRTDVAVLHYTSDCLDHSGTDAGFHQLKNILSRNLGKPTDGWEREDQNYRSFSADGIHFSICYTYSDDSASESCHTTLSIENTRNYPDLLIDKSYEQQMQISEVVIIPGKINISADYKRNPRIKRRPQTIIGSFQEKAVIWKDELNKKIGFSSGNFMQVFNESEIKSFYVYNFLPAKADGFADLVVETAEGRLTVFSAGCHTFDAYLKKIETLTDKRVYKMDDQYNY